MPVKSYFRRTIINRFQKQLVNCYVVGGTKIAMGVYIFISQNIRNVCNLWTKTFRICLVDRCNFNDGSFRRNIKFFSTIEYFSNQLIWIRACFQLQHENINLWSVFPETHQLFIDLCWWWSRVPFARSKQLNFVYFLMQTENKFVYSGIRVGG